ncbi:Cell surface protein [Rhodopirellula islandica]|uniref:Cell surface protein n=1 Tax=Rhodopirellula islandica TaxID=595434 RepID=A0A0J1EE88_RHOIS|nr:DUF4465 domain-containing protein [Rhodopirellula islandica]KLU03814.1 Cell surface protein [Rhodopirellula islandica]
MNPLKPSRFARRRQLHLTIEQLESRQLLAAGPYAPAANEVGSSAIDRESPAIVGWATGVEDYTPGAAVDEVWQESSRALGPAEGQSGSIVSLGRAGTLTLTFEDPIRDGLGFDFAVFENSFSDTFLELGYVEVSSDGVNFVRFESDSRTDSAVAAFGSIDPTNLNNLAGKYRGGFGTPFDLQELRGTAGLDVTAITHVRLVDIFGDGTSLDGQGDPIYDPTPTTGSAGLDVDGVAVLHAKQTGPAIIDFETLGSELGASTFSNQAPNGFEQEELSLNNDYNSLYGSWQGWSISKTTDSTTADFSNQYSAFPGEGHDGSDTYAVGFYSEYASPENRPTLELDPEVGSQFDSLWITNTTYAALSMTEGDQFAKQFGGDSGTDPDFYEVDIHGLDDAGTSIGTVTVVLADFRFENSEDDFIVDEWIQVDLSSLESAQALQFQVRSSDIGDFGINTPTYFAVDDVVVKRPQVALDFEDTSLLESESMIGRVSRPALDSSSLMTVSISNSNSSLVNLPTQVTIAAGADYAEFTVSTSDDDLAGPNQMVEFTATAELQAPRTRELSVLDDDATGLVFSSSSLQQTEGASATTLTLRRNDFDISSPLAVSVSAQPDSRLNYPASLTFPAGQREVSLVISITDDEKFSPAQSVQLVATAEGHAESVATVELLDDDSRALTATNPASPLEESNPSQTVTAIIHRNDASLDQPMTIGLTNPNPELLTMPASIVIPSGFDSVEVTIGLIDNDVANTSHTFTVVASNPNAATAEFDVTVIDDEAPTFVLALLDSQGVALNEVTEGQSVRLSVTRPASSVSESVTVTLEQSLTERIDGPLEVTIPAGATAAELTWLIEPDETLTGSLDWVIEASTPGFETARLETTVLDSDSPALTISGPTEPLLESDSTSIGDFESFGQTLVADEFNNNAGQAGVFVDGELTFGNSFSNAYGFDSWSGFSISRESDTTTSGFFNQYAAITGEGVRDSNTYAIGYNGADAIIRRSNDSQPFESIAVTNTTYAALSMLNGDAFAKQFGGESGDDPDTFVLTIIGKNENGESIGEVGFHLADYRFEDNSLDYIVDEWTTVDLTPIGQATQLHFGLSSTDVGQFGMNTPGYFALDDVQLAAPGEGLPQLTLHRQTLDNSEPLEVSLVADRTDIRIPETIVIPSGQDSVSVPVRLIDNLLAEDNREVAITATANGFAPQVISLTIEDNDTQSLTVTHDSNETLNESQIIVINVEDTGSSLDAESFHNGSDLSGAIVAGPLEFPNVYNEQYDFWSGWAASNVTDVATPGYSNQYAAYSNLSGDQPGGGDSSETFLIGAGSGDSAPTLTLPETMSDARFASISLTNSTYAALSMQQGDSFAKQFGGETGDDPDYFLLTIVGLDLSGETVGSVDFYLADYRFENNSLDYIVGEWTTIDLTSLDGASQLRFDLSSSDVGDFGMNTPAYFAADNVILDQVSAEPTSVVIHRNAADLSSALPLTFESDDPRFAIDAPIEIPAGADSVRIPVSILNDRTVNTDGSARWTVSADGHIAGDANVSIQDDETPGIELHRLLQPLEVIEGEAANLYEVRLSQRPASSVTVSVEALIESMDAGEQLSLSANTLTFTPDNWSEPQTITVSANVDTLQEPNQTVQLTLQIVSDLSDPGYASAESQQDFFTLVDYQPTDLSLALEAEQLVLRDLRNDSVWTSNNRDERFVVVLNGQAQSLSVASLAEATGLVTIEMGAGDDHVLLDTTWFTSIDGGEGFDRLILQPSDGLANESGGSTIDLAAWLQNRVVGFEELVLGASNPDEPLTYRLDSARLTTLLGTNAPTITSIGSQNLELTGSWQLGAPLVADGLIRQRLVSETIEVQVITSTPWQNAIRSEDVNANGEVTALDALTVINRLNSGESDELLTPNDPNELIGRFYDVSGDGRVSALDALQVINYLNGETASGEPVTSSPDARSIQISPESSRIEAITTNQLNQAQASALDGPQTLASIVPESLRLSDPGGLSTELIDQLWSESGRESDDDSDSSENGEWIDSLELLGDSA